MRILLEFINQNNSKILHCAQRLVVSSSKKYVVIMQSITIEKYAGCKRISYTAHNEPKLFMKSQLYVCQYGNSTRFATHFTVNHALKICIKKHSWRRDDKEIKCDFKKDLTPNCSTLQRQFIKISELLE